MGSGRESVIFFHNIGSPCKGSTRSEHVATQLGHPRLEQVASGPFEWQRGNIPLSRQSFSKFAEQYATQMAHPRLEQSARGVLELQGVNISVTRLATLCCP